MAKGKKSKYGGTVYKNRYRYWWRVQLPGETEKKARPLRPPGARHATSDRKVAEALASELWQRAMFRADNDRQSDGTIASTVAAYDKHALSYYKGPDGKPSSEYSNVKNGIEYLVAFCGTQLAEDFTSLDLKSFQKYLIGLKRKDKKEPKLARSTVNRYVGIVRRMFKWAASEMFIPASTYQALLTVEGLRRGRSEARETPDVKAVDPAFVYRVLPHASPTVAAMIELQLLTGMRSGELTILRPIDIDTSGKVWLYRPTHHKTAHHGHVREIAIGPKGQKILKPFLARKVTSFCFVPAESAAWHRQIAHERRTTPMNEGNRPGSHRKDNPKTQPGERYTSDGYGQAMKHTIKRARAAGVDVPDFSPHRLRHTAATLIRKESGLDAARALLGHRNMRITDDYAEIDRALAVDAMMKHG